VEKLRELKELLNQERDKLDENLQAERSLNNNLRKQITDLNQQMDELRLEIKKTSSQLEEQRQVSAKSATLSRQTKTKPTHIDLNDPILYDAHGWIYISDIISFNASIEELIKAGSADNPASVLMAMKAIVVATRSISETVEEAELAAQNGESSSALRTGQSSNSQHHWNIDFDKTSQLRNDVSSHLTDLMTVAKNQTSGNVTPLQVLEDTARELVNDISRITQLVKIASRGRQTKRNSDHRGTAARIGGPKTPETRSLNELSRKPSETLSDSSTRKLAPKRYNMEELKVCFTIILYFMYLLLVFI
jgi:hypothetical protein